MWLARGGKSLCQEKRQHYWITRGPVWRVELASSGYSRQLRVWQAARGDVCTSEWCHLDSEWACESWRDGVRTSFISSARLTRRTNTPNSKISLDYEGTNKKSKATPEQLRQSYPTLLRCSYVIFGVSATVSAHGLIRRRAAVMHRGVHFCLLGVSSLRVRVSSVSFSGCSSVPAPSVCLLRLTAAGASRCSCTTRPPVETERPWCALMRTPSLQQGSARPPFTTKTCPRVTDYVGPRALI